MLETLDGAFPPKRTTSDIYHDNRYDDQGGGVGSGRDKVPMEFGDTGDSLDRLAGSATDRQRLSRSVRLDVSVFVFPAGAWATTDFCRG